MIEEQIRRKIQDLIIRSQLLAPDSGVGLHRDTAQIRGRDGWLTEALNVVELPGSWSNCYNGDCPPCCNWVGLRS